MDDSNDSNEQNEEDKGDGKTMNRKQALAYKKELIDAKKKAVEIDKWIEGNVKKAKEKEEKEAKENEDGPKLKLPEIDLSKKQP